MVISKFNNSLMRKYGKDEGARAYLEEVREFEKKLGKISHFKNNTVFSKKLEDLVANWLMNPNHNIRITPDNGCVAISLIIGKYDFWWFSCVCANANMKLVESLMSEVRDDVAARKTKLAKMNAAKEAAKAEREAAKAKRDAAKAKRESAKKEEAKRNAPMKNMVNGFKNKISSLEIAIYNRNNIITKKDDEIVALKKRIASLALEIEQVRNENDELAIYKELVEEYMNDAA